MKILVYSLAFAPSVGGSETACASLVDALIQARHQVKVATLTPTEGIDENPCPIFRNPSVVELFRLHAWADLVIHSNISLKATWPLLILRRPWMIVHHSSLVGLDGTVGIAQRCKQLAAFFATNVTVSSSMAASLTAPSQIIGNSFRATIFRKISNIERNRDFIFAGTLFASKGVDLAIRALAQLHAQGLRPRLTVAGDGSSREALEALTTELKITHAVDFLGYLTPEALANQFNAHRALVAPSLLMETFGLVVLEAIACGCVPVVSNVGGLVDTVGNCGFVIEEGSVDQLAQIMRQLFEQPHLASERLQFAEAHLDQFREERIASAYLELIESLESKSRR